MLNDFSLSNKSHWALFWIFHYFKWKFPNVSIILFQKDASCAIKNEHWFYLIMSVFNNPQFRCFLSAARLMTANFYYLSCILTFMHFGNFEMPKCHFFPLSSRNTWICHPVCPRSRSSCRQINSVWHHQETRCHNTDL